MAKAPWHNRYRYVILVVGLLCLTSISSNTLAFNLAQVCMASSSHLNETNEKSHSYPYIDYTPSEISLINGAMAFGITIATIPCSLSFDHFGMKWPLFFSGLLSAISTALMPLAAMYHLYAVLMLRVFQGIAYSSNLPAVGKLCSSWASLKQTGVFISVLTSYMALSSGLTNSFGGMICESSYGWPYVYYAHSVVCVLLFAIWILCYDDIPAQSQQVTPKELSKIHRNKTQAQVEHSGKIKMPYRLMLTDFLIWIIWFNAFAEFFITIFLTLYSPYYIKNALKYNIEKTGHYAAISRIAQVPFRLTFGYLSDKIKYFDDNVKLVVFNSIALGGAGICLLAIGFVPDDYPIFGVILLTMISILTGAGSSGFFKGAVLYTRQYSQFVIGNCQLIKCAILFLAPLAVAVFVTNSSDKSEWKIIFLITGAVALSVNFLFCRFSKAHPAEYTAEGFFDENLRKVDPTVGVDKLEMTEKSV